MRFEINDVRAGIALINMVLIIFFGVSVVWFSLGVTFLGLLKDVMVDKKISGFAMHLANMILNIFLLLNI